jgi:hypothetical protein
MATELQEIERLRRLYPLFKFEPNDYGLSLNLWDCKYNDNSSLCNILIDGRPRKGIEQTLDNYHLRQTIANKLELQYPDLKISVYFNRTDINVSVWVKRDGKDRESIGSTDMLRSDFNQTMTGWQEQAAKAKLPDMFFCSGHCRAEHCHNGQFFHFAGNYCIQYGVENPQVLKDARNETYE